MYGLKKLLQEEQARLERLLKRAEASICEEPEGYLRISKDKKQVRYYHCVKDNKGKYIRASEKKLPGQLAQKTYDISVVKWASRRLKQIGDILKDYSDDEIEKLYSSLKPERKALIIPVAPDWETRVKNWQEETYVGKEFKEGSAIIRTEHGERVRSKSEMIIADYLFHHNIPYKYEKPLLLTGGVMVYPDFTLLSRKTGREIYWEHEGMMDNPDYARKAVRKLDSYQKSGFFPGESLILTFETETNVINTELFEEIVKRYL